MPCYVVAGDTLQLQGDGTKVSHVASSSVTRDERRFGVPRMLQQLLWARCRWRRTWPTSAMRSSAVVHGQAGSSAFVGHWAPPGHPAAEKKNLLTMAFSRPTIDKSVGNPTRSVCRAHL